MIEIIFPFFRMEDQGAKFDSHEMNPRMEEPIPKYDSHELNPRIEDPEPKYDSREINPRMEEQVSKFDPDEINPWNVTSVEEFLFYCCPECDSKHTSRDVFINHALLQHPKVKTSFHFCNLYKVHGMVHQ